MEDFKPDLTKPHFYHQDRLFISDGLSRVYWSAKGDYYDWWNESVLTKTSYHEAETGYWEFRGEVIIAIAPFGNHLLIHTDKHTHMLIGDSVSNFKTIEIK